jgi:hypothetical protein
LASYARKEAGASEPSLGDPPEEMRSQNRATIEAVERARAMLEQRIDRLEEETRTRDTGLEMAIRELRGDVRQTQEHVRDLTARVAALAHLGERVTLLEKRMS